MPLPVQAGFFLATPEKSAKGFSPRQGNHHPAMTQLASGSRRLRDYRHHYRVDAEAIVDPQVLPPTRRASEERRLEALVRLLRLNPGEKLLDLGCGSGWLAERCRQAGARVWAADLALAGVAGARARYPQVDYFQVADVYHLPFVAGCFDAKCVIQ
mgnify:CR=1 FL=1